MVFQHLLSELLSLCLRLMISIIMLMTLIFHKGLYHQHLAMLVLGFLILPMFSLLLTLHSMLSSPMKCLFHPFCQLIWSGTVLLEEAHAYTSLTCVTPQRITSSSSVQLFLQVTLAISCKEGGR